MRLEALLRGRFDALLRSYTISRKMRASIMIATISKEPVKNALCPIAVILYKRINRWRSESSTGIASRSSIFSSEVICPERYTVAEIFSFFSQRELSGRKKA
jgi:hypothetical protein